MSKLILPEEGTLITKEELIPILQDLLAKQLVEIKKAIAKPDVVIPPIVLPPTLPGKCKRGPDIEKATKNSVRRIQTRFDGEDVTLIQATFINPEGKNILTDVLSKKTGLSLLVKGGKEGVFAPDDNEQILSLSESVVSGKKYTINFKGVACTGESSFTFFFEDSVTAPPPIEENKPCKPLGKITNIELTNK